MKQSMCTISSNLEIMPEVHLMSFESPYIASTAQPGQFITVRCNGVILRRPFSIHKVSSAQVSILFQTVGKGTAWLSKQGKGTKLDILGPLGRAFKLKPRSKHLLLVAGGIGIAPLFFLIQRTLTKHSITLVQGASTASLIYPLSSLLVHSSTETQRHEKDSSSLMNLGLRHITVTDDGSSGQKGVTTDLIVDFLDWTDQVFACGPTGMYMTMSALFPNVQNTKLINKSVKGYQKNKAKLDRCQISLELRMGCGIGTCYGCSINTKDGRQKVCHDGPVFELGQIIWDEILI